MPDVNVSDEGSYSVNSKGTMIKSHTKQAAPCSPVGVPGKEGHPRTPTKLVGMRF